MAQIEDHQDLAEWFDCGVPLRLVTADADGNFLTASHVTGTTWERRCDHARVFWFTVLERNERFGLYWESDNEYLDVPGFLLSPDSEDET